MEFNNYELPLLPKLSQGDRYFALKKTSPPLRALPSPQQPTKMLRQHATATEDIYHRNRLNAISLLIAASKF